MANTSQNSPKKNARNPNAPARKKAKAEKPKKPRDYARGSKKRKGEEVGSRPVETVKAAIGVSAWHLAGKVLSCLIGIRTPAKC